MTDTMIWVLSDIFVLRIHFNNTFTECPESKQGDGQCQDFCNTLYFDYDNGDCCLDYIYDLRCSDCLCHHDMTKHLPSNTASHRPSTFLENFFLEKFEKKVKILESFETRIENFSISKTAHPVHE